jgi:hypothetical protein
MVERDRGELLGDRIIDDNFRHSVVAEVRVTEEAE